MTGSPERASAADVHPGSIGVVAVGDELLAGAHPDLNSPYLAHRAIEFGRFVRRVVVVGDEEPDIAEAVRSLSKDCALVFVSGGLGPTLDDVTRHGVAKALGVPLDESESAWDEIRAWFDRAGRIASDTNRRQALFPRGAKVLQNAFGTAPGFLWDAADGPTVIVLPGPPRELQGMFGDVVEPWLAAHPVDARQRAKRVLSFGDVPESTFAEAVGAWMERDANPLVGVTVKEGILTARCLAVADTAEEADALASGRAAEIKALFADRYLGDAIESLGRHVGGVLAEAGLRFTVAESCTGGRVAAALTDTPGISAVFDGSFVTYANAWKVRSLGVSEADLERHGAVSEAVATGMAAGALERADARLAVSITGVAGPGGGTDEKPVGLVWFGVATKEADGTVQTRSYERRWPPVSRGRVRAWATNKALALLLEEGRRLAAQAGE